MVTRESFTSYNLPCQGSRMMNKHSVNASSKSSLIEAKQDDIEKMIPRFVNNIKLCTRSCLMLFSSKRDLPTELNKLLSILNIARAVSITMKSNQPTIERADRLEELMSEALTQARKFRGVKACNDVYGRVERMKRLMTPGVGMVRALIRALEDTVSDSKDESDSEDDSDSEDELTDSDSDSDSEDCSSDEETGSDSEDDSETEEEEMVSDQENIPSTCKMQCTAPCDPLVNSKVLSISSQVHTPTVELVQQDTCVNQDMPVKTQSSVIPYAPPRRPEDCKTKLSKDLSKLLWATRRKVEEKQAKGSLNFTIKNNTQGFKNRGSQSHSLSQLKANFSKSCTKLTSGNISSLMGDLVDVKTVKSFPSASKPQSERMLSQATETPKDMCSETKSVILQVSNRVQPIMSTEELATNLDNSFSSDKYKLSKSMDDITEQLSRSSIGATHSLTVNALGSKDIELKDGPVKFILRSSPLTAVLEQRKKNGQSLLLPSFIQNCSTGQTEAVKPKKMVNPIKESRLTALVKDEVTVYHYVKIFADKMQQTLLNELKAASHIPPVRHMGRVILTAKRTKRSLCVKTCTNNTLPRTYLLNHSTSGGHRLSLGTMVKPGHEESITRVSLGKRSSNSLSPEHLKPKLVKCAT